jgi:glutathione S-transferase
MYTLHIGNKNYSSWSLRPWVLMKACGIAFEEKLHRFGPDFSAQIAPFSPTGKVPCLTDDETTVWDSLAIVEYLAERHPQVWPTDPKTRAWARCAAAEMHSGFTTLRNQHGMNVGLRVAVTNRAPELLADIARIDALWNEGLSRFGGPYLAGAEFTAVDAFFAPVIFRVQTYGISLAPAAAAYVQTMLTNPAMREWETAALAEDFRDLPHEADIALIGTISADLRTPAVMI